MVRFSGYTLKNTKSADKPNEDRFFFDAESGFVLLLDGVSRDKIKGAYPNPSPAEDAADIILRESYEYFLSHGLQKEDPIGTLVDAVLQANRAVLRYNEQKSLDFRAGAVGIIGCLINMEFYYIYIGDCYGRTVSGNKVSFFTSCQTANIAKHKSEYTTYEIRNVICNNPDHVCGYGVLNGDPNAAYFIRTGVIGRDQYDRIILSSDGPEEYLATCSAGQMAKHSCEELIKASVQGKNQDDMTMLIIER